MPVTAQIRFKSSKFEIRHDEVQQLEVELGCLASPGEQEDSCCRRVAACLSRRAPCCVWPGLTASTSMYSGAPAVGLDLSTTGFKANLFNKDFKKQVLAADALKAWVLNNPDEVSAEPWVLRHASPAHPCDKGVRRYPARLSVGTWTHRSLWLLLGVLVHPLTCSASARPVCRRWSRAPRAWTCCCAGVCCAWLTATRRRLSASPACSRCVARGLVQRLHRCVGPVRCAAMPPVVLLPSCAAVVCGGVNVCTGPV